MPLILLLNQHLGVVNTGVRKIASLGDTMERAADVLRRRRGAFFTAWFGAGLPVDGLQVRAVIVNGPALLARIDAVRRMQAEYAARRSGPNLLEPIAGMAGVLTGALVGAFATVLAIVSVLAVAALPLLPVGLVVAVATVVAWIGLLLRGRALWKGYSGLAGAPGGRSSGMPAWYEMGAEGAAALRTGIDVGRSVLAGSGAARDPLTRAVLHLADRAAALAIRVLGAAATFLSLAPVVEALHAALEPLRRLADHLVAIGRAAIESVVDAVKAGIRRGGLLAMVSLLRRFLPWYVAELHQRMRYGLTRVTHPVSVVAAEARRLWGQLQTWAAPITTRHPAVVFLQGLGALGRAVGGVGARLRAMGARIRANLTPTSVQAVLDAVSTIHRWVSRPSATPGLRTRPPAPPPPPPTPLDAAAALGTFVAAGGVTGTLAPTVAGLLREELAARPIQIVGVVPRVFPAERERERRTGAAALQDSSFRTARAILRGAAELAGPAVDKQVATLEQRLAELEAPLRERAAPLPVRDLPAPRRLVPVVRRLRVAAPGRGTSAPSAAGPTT